MSSNVRRMSCTPEQVFDVLADGWLFPVWVVGASRMRDVDEAWPEEGSRLHHSFGVWPVLIDDQTTVLEWDPPHRMVIKPAGWPLGEAKVTVEAKAVAGGCVVRILEEAIKGPGALIPDAVLDVPLHIRNIETLRRLAFVAEGRDASVHHADGRHVDGAHGHLDDVDGTDGR